jgi:hypothetical protein
MKLLRPIFRISIYINVSPHSRYKWLALRNNIVCISSDNFHKMYDRSRFLLASKRYAHLLLEYIPSEEIRVRTLLLIRFQLLTAVTMKYTVLWVVTLCSSETAKRFWVTCRLNLQGRKASKATNQPDVCWFLDWLSFRPWRWRRYVPPKRRVLSELYGVTPQMSLVFTFLFMFIETWRKYMKQSEHPYNTNHTNWVKSGLASFPPKFLLNSTVQSNWTAPHSTPPPLLLLWNLHVYQTIAPSHGTAKRSTLPKLTSIARAHIGRHNASASFTLKMMTEMYSKTLKQPQNRRGWTPRAEITHWTKQVARWLSSNSAKDFRIGLKIFLTMSVSAADHLLGTEEEPASNVGHEFAAFMVFPIFSNVCRNSSLSNPRLLICTCQFCSH